MLLTGIENPFGLLFEFIKANLLISRSFTMTAGVKVIILYLLQSLPSNTGYLAAPKERNNFLPHHFDS